MIADEVKEERGRKDWISWSLEGCDEVWMLVRSHWRISGRIAWFNMRFLKVLSACSAVIDCTEFRNREQVDRKLLTMALVRELLVPAW